MGTNRGIFYINHYYDFPLNAREIKEIKETKDLEEFLEIIQELWRPMYRANPKESWRDLSAAYLQFLIEYAPQFEFGDTNVYPVLDENNVTKFLVTYESPLTAETIFARVLKNSVKFEINNLAHYLEKGWI